MKILIVSWSILPSKGGSSIIIENLAQNFKKGDLFVLGSKNIMSSATYHRPKDGPEFIYFNSEFHLFGRGKRYFHWLKRWMFRPLVNKIKTIIKKENIDHVMGVYPDHIFCHAACVASKESNTLFSSYFHNTYADNKAVTDASSLSIQKEIFETSENIFVMSGGMLKFYESKYPEYNFSPLVHTFNEYPDKEDLTGIPGNTKEKYSLVAIGNFNESNMEATIRFVDAIKGNPKYELTLYTHVPPLLLKIRGLDTEAVNLPGFVDAKEVITQLQRYDICILTHGFTGGYGPHEYKTIFPTRTIPLLLCGKPIFAHSPPGSFLNEFISNNGCALLVDKSSKKHILDGLEKLTNSIELQNKLSKAALKAAAQFYGPKVVDNLVHMIQNSKNNIS